MSLKQMAFRNLKSNKSGLLQRRQKASTSGKGLKKLVLLFSDIYFCLIGLMFHELSSGQEIVFIEMKTDANANLILPFPKNIQKFADDLEHMFAKIRKIYINLKKNRKLMQRINVAGNPYCNYAYYTYIYIIVVEKNSYQLKGILEHQGWGQVKMYHNLHFFCQRVECPSLKYY